MALDQDKRDEDLLEDKPIDLSKNLKKTHRAAKKTNRVGVIAIACVSVAALASLAIFLPRWIPEKEPDTAPSTVVKLTEIPIDDIASINVAGENTLTVTKDGSAYHMDILPDEKTDQGTLGAAFSNAANLNADLLVEESAQDLRKYGLDTPSSLVTIAKNDSTKLVFELGDVLSVTGQIYARLQGQADVYLLKPYLSELYGGKTQRYHSLTVPEVSADTLDARSIIVRQRGQEQVRMMPFVDANSIATGSWKATEPKEYSLDSAQIAELVTAIADFKVSQYVGGFTDLAPYGLVDPLVSVIFSDTKGGKREIAIGSPVEGEGAYYCTIDGSGDVYKCAESSVTALVDFKLSYYLDPFANIISIYAVDGWEIADGSKTYTSSIVRKEQLDEAGKQKTLANGQPDYAETFFLGGKEVQESAYKAAYQAIIGVTIEGIADPALVDPNAMPVLTIKYGLNTQAEPLLIEYLPYDINNYCVRKNGQIELFVKKVHVDAIMPTLLQLEKGELDKKS